MKKKAFKVAGEFKEFLVRGSVIDLAIGVIMGTTFTKIVTSLANEMLMPAIGYLIGGINFADFKIVLATATETVPEAAILYGSFIQNIINFILTALVVFMIVKLVNRFRRKKEEEPKKLAEYVVLLTEIRDLLKGDKATDESDAK